MAEEHSQAFGKTERHESVWKTQEKIILGVLGEKQGSFLGTGRAEMEALAAEGTKELLSTFRIGAPYAGDSLGIVPAENELLHHLRDLLQSEPPVCGGWLRGLQSKRQLWLYIDI